MVSSGVLNNKTLVALHALVDLGLLNSPLANVGPFLLVLAVLLGVGRRPSLLQSSVNCSRKGALRVVGCRKPIVSGLLLVRLEGMKMKSQVRRSFPRHPDRCHVH